MRLGKPKCPICLRQVPELLELKTRTVGLQVKRIVNEDEEELLEVTTRPRAECTRGMEEGVEPDDSRFQITRPADGPGMRLDNLFNGTTPT